MMNQRHKSMLYGAILISMLQPAVAAEVTAVLDMNSADRASTFKAKLMKGDTLSVYILDKEIDLSDKSSSVTKEDKTDHYVVKSISKPEKKLEIVDISQGFMLEKVQKCSSNAFKKILVKIPEEVSGLLVGDYDNNAFFAEAQKKCVEAIFTVRNTENSQSGFIHVKMTPTPTPTPTPVDLDKVLIHINLASSFSISASGGFFISDLTSKKYYAKPTTVANEFVITRNSSAEDDYDLGLAGFVNTCYESKRETFWRTVLVPRCATFGLGFTDQTKGFNFLPAISWRLGNDVYFSVGAQIAKVNVLANDHQVGDVINNAVDLNSNMGSRYESAPFISISYGFLGSGFPSTLNGSFSKNPLGNP